MTLTAHYARLDSGWTWLDANPDHAEYAIREDRYLLWIDEYTAAWRQQPAHEAAMARQEILL